MINSRMARFILILAVLPCLGSQCFDVGVNDVKPEPHTALTLPRKYATGQGQITQKFEGTSCTNSGPATVTIDATGALELLILLPGTPILLEGACSMSTDGANGFLVNTPGVLTDADFTFASCNQGSGRGSGGGSFSNGGLNIAMLGTCEDPKTDAVDWTFHANVSYP